MDIWPDYRSQTVDRLREALRRERRLTRSQILRTLIRDRTRRDEAVRQLVTEGRARIEVIKKPLGGLRYEVISLEEPE